MITFTVRALTRTVKCSWNLTHHHHHHKPVSLIQLCSLTSAASSYPVPVYSRAVEFGDKTAVIDSQGSYSYSELYRSSKKLSTRIQSSIRHGDRVAVLTPNNVQYVRSQWAVWMCGGVCVPLCKSHPASSLSYYLQDSGAKLVLVTPDLHPTVSDLVGVKMLVVEDEDVKDTDVNIDDDLMTPEASS